MNRGRQAQAIKLFLLGRAQEIALITRRIRRAVQLCPARPNLSLNIVPRRHTVSGQIRGRGQQIRGTGMERRQLVFMSARNPTPSEVSMTVRPALSSPCRTTAPPNVNAYDSRLKQWMHRCHAVATKYSENYLGCRRMIERYRQNISPAACLHEAVGRWQPQ